MIRCKCGKHYNDITDLINCDCNVAEPNLNVLGEVADEMNKAISQFPAFHSLHEGYAMMLEEVDELWEHVKTNQKRRDKEAIKKECIQIAAMALRIILDCGDMDK